jgi:phage terminase large subunit
LPTIEIPYTPQPRQMKFHECPADEVLYGGAAGGGKSRAILMDALANALQYDKSKQIVFRRTFSELERTLILESRILYPKELAKYNESKHRWTFLNGSIIEFSYLDKESDVFNYQGAEYDFIYFDELTHFTETQYTYMLSRLRGTNPNIHRQVKSATNPGGVGHHWVKQRFIDPAPPETVWKTDDGRTRCFIPAKVYDNLALLNNDPDYVKRLGALDENTRKQLLEGDWDVFAGQFFTEFSRDIHVVQPFSIPSHWRKIRAMDEGYNDPFVCLWLAFDEHNNCFVYKEFVKSQLLSEEQARAVLELTGDEKIHYSVGDTSFWNKSKTSGESPADVFFKLGLPMIQATKERVNGWKRVREWLHVFEDTDPVTGQKFKNSRLKIFNTCVNLIESLPAMVVDEKNPEDIAPHPLDHCPDALRYGLMSWPMPAKQPEPELPKDPEQRWLYEMDKLHFKKVQNRVRRSTW